MKKQEYEITAKSIEEFEIIKKKIDSLPAGIISQIEKVHKKITLVYVNFKKQYDDRPRVLLPLDIIDLSVSDTGFCCFNSEFTFEMEKTKEQRFLFNFSKPQP